MYTNIKYFQKDASLYVEAKGKLDIYNSQDYLEEIKKHIKYVKELILEFSEITYIASIGLRTILELYKIMQAQNGKMKLKNVNEEVLYAIKITGFDKFLTIENDADNEAQ